MHIFIYYSSLAFVTLWAADCAERPPGASMSLASRAAWTFGCKRAMLRFPSLGPVGVLAVALTAWCVSPPSPRAVPVSGVDDSSRLLLDEIPGLKELVPSGRSGRGLEREVSFAVVGCLLGFVGGSTWR